MTNKKIRMKVFTNKRTKQLTVVIPKKKVKASKPGIKFGEELFVDLEVFNKKTRKK